MAGLATSVAVPEPSPLGPDHSQVRAFREAHREPVCFRVTSASAILPTPIDRRGNRAGWRTLQRVAPMPGGTLPSLGLHLLLGEGAGEAVRGQIRNLSERRLQIVQAAFERR